MCFLHHDRVTSYTQCTWALCIYTQGGDGQPQIIQLQMSTDPQQQQQQPQQQEQQQQNAQIIQTLQQQQQQGAAVQQQDTAATTAAIAQQQQDNNASLQDEQQAGTTQVFQQVVTSDGEVMHLPVSHTRTAVWYEHTHWHYILTQ